jgi:hypothetical protein
MPTATAATKPTAASKTARPKPVPVPNADFYQLIELLTPEEKAVVTKVRTLDGLNTRSTWRFKARMASSFIRPLPPQFLHGAG